MKRNNNLSAARTFIFDDKLSAGLESVPQPKQFKTRVSRVETYTQPILEGKGLND
ncbi:hypothetical protein ACLMCB_21765 [Paenibacillus sp. S29]|uniref:hypothetical protein n=1 Tax=Paenibacillus TaxID=44249 RepID=UPI0020242B34|nr:MULTISPECIES: hypothetical protein [Paenibacillus]WGV33793.1 hypothetical protein MF627_08150 [Paenibacillus polymyxa]